MPEPSREIEKKYSYDRTQLVGFLTRFRDGVDAGEVRIEDESIQIPEEVMEVEYGFKIEKGKKEIEIEIKWKE
jgi:amphi-Trp domain-containing protein